MSTQNRGSKRQIETAALNAEWKMDDGSERQTESTALNTKLKVRLWTPNEKNVIALDV